MVDCLGGVSKTELTFAVDRHHVQMSVRHLETGDDHAHSFRRKNFHLSFGHSVSHLHQVSIGLFIQIDPVGNLFHRDHQSVPGADRIDREKGDRFLVAADKMSRQVAGDDFRKHSHKRPFEKKDTTLSMPELPEVETVRRSIAERVRGRRIEAVSVRDDYVLRGQPVRDFVGGLRGLTFSESCRHGKLLFFPLGEITLCVHLGMTGQLTARLPDRADTPFQVHKKTGLQRTLQHPPDKHTHISLELEDGTSLHYRDIRKFGRVFWIPKSGRDEVVEHFGLGVDPLTSSFSTTYLGQGLNKRRVAVKAALLDQKFLAGLGNIYVDEALHLAGIRPGRGAFRVRGKMLEALSDAILVVLEKGIKAGGTTLRDFVNADGEGGYNQEGLMVYGRYGEACPRCGALLRRGVYGGRTTTWCAGCQK